MGLAEKQPINRRFVLGSVFLIANALIWYFTAATVLESAIESVSTSPTQTLLMWSVHFGSLMLSLIIGAFLIKKIESKWFFTLWTIIGIVSPLFLLTLGFGQVWVAFLLSGLFGVSFGLGMPNCMELFTNVTDTKNRGRYSGLVMLLSGLGIAFFGLIDVTNIEMVILILIVWRLIGLVILPFQKLPKEKVSNDVSFTSIINQRSFILYLIPWLMFSLVGYLGVPIQERILGQSTINLLMLIEAALMGIFAVISGHLLDILGRKRVAMVGFILMGVGYSVLGIYPFEMSSWFFYTVVDGVAWGIFYVIFVISIWSDLSPNGRSGKYYAIGVLPFFISKFLQIAIGKSVANISEYALFSFIAFFLFLAVLPLVYAPETLPEKIMKERELKSYIAKAQKMVGKEQGKKEAEDKEAENSKEEQPAQENSEDYEKAKQLAEKYY